MFKFFTPLFYVLVSDSILCEMNFLYRSEINTHILLAMVTPKAEAKLLLREEKTFTQLAILSFVLIHLFRHMRDKAQHSLGALAYLDQVLSLPFMCQMKSTLV